MRKAAWREGEWLDWLYVRWDSGHSVILVFAKSARDVGGMNRRRWRGRNGGSGRHKEEEHVWKGQNQEQRKTGGKKTRRARKKKAVLRISNTGKRWGHMMRNVISVKISKTGMLNCDYKLLKHSDGQSLQRGILRAAIKKNTTAIITADTLKIPSIQTTDRCLC